MSVFVCVCVLSRALVSLGSKLHGRGSSVTGILILRRNMYLDLGRMDLCLKFPFVLRSHRPL